MVFAAAGTLTSIENTPAGSTQAYSLTTTRAGNWVLLALEVNAQPATAVTGGLGGSTWAQLTPTVTLPVLNGTLGFGNIWAGRIAAAGTANVTVTYAAALAGANSRFAAREFSTSSGLITLDAQGSVTAATASWATLTPSTPGELYWGYCEDAVSATPGATSGFVYETDANGNGEGYCLSVSSAYTPVWGDSTMQAGVMVLIREVNAPAPSFPATRTEVISRASGRVIRR